MVRLPPTEDGEAAADVLVDDVHLWIIKAWKWGVRRYGYVTRRTSVRDGRAHPKGRREYLHRVIMGLQHGDPREVDHINGDPTDNRLVNLEIVTRAENLRRREERRGSDAS